MTTPFAGNNNSSSGGSLMFGSSPNNMTTAVAPHHPAGGFSGINNNNAGTMMFGQSSSIGGFGSTQNNNNNNLESLPFGGSSQANMSNTAIHNTPFGNSNNNSNSRSNAPFGGQSFQQQQTPLFGGPAVGTTPSTTATSNNPFANPFAQNQEHVQQSTMPQSMSFGQSTNIIASNTNPTSTSSSTQFGGGWPISQSRSSDTSSRPFGDSTDTFPGSTSSGLAPFGLSASNDDGMMDDVPEPSLSNLLFGQPAFSTTKTGHATGMGDTNTTGSRMFGRPDTVVVDDLPGNNNNEALLRLQSKIEAKKKKLAEQKQMREATVAAASSLRPDAAPFQPPSSNHPGMPSQGAPSQTELRGSVSAATDSDSEALQNVAQRNAIRFADSVDTGTRSQLPTDLLSLSADATAVQTALRNAGGRSARENLENAVSLVGTCEHMCPDEELLRREREGDIQLLERPIPDGIFHPKSWTLRNTMVKRFRRSAADYKLDVPEWVRPPDVLERVCSYLEEWVMVSRMLCALCLGAVLF